MLDRARSQRGRQAPFVEVLLTASCRSLLLGGSSASLPRLACCLRRCSYAKPLMCRTPPCRRRRRRTRLPVLALGCAAFLERNHALASTSAIASLGHAVTIAPWKDCNLPLAAMKLSSARRLWVGDGIGELRPLSRVGLVGLRAARTQTLTPAGYRIQHLSAIGFVTVGLALVSVYGPYRQKPWKCQGRVSARASARSSARLTEAPARKCGTSPDGRHLGRGFSPPATRPRRRSRRRFRAWG
jgi:hypothetical protein